MGDARDGKAAPESHDDASRESAESDRFRALADHATELVAEFDEDGRCLYASPSYRTLLGIDPSQLVGRAPTRLIHPDDRDSSTSRFLKAIADEGGAPVAEERRPS